MQAPQVLGCCHDHRQLPDTRHERIIACSIQVQQPWRLPPTARDRRSPRR
jgi:hypothetical protein